VFRERVNEVDVGNGESLKVGDVREEKHMREVVG